MRVIVCPHIRIYAEHKPRFATFEIECLECKRTKRVTITQTQLAVHESYGPGRKK